MILLKLFAAFARVGVLTFGGGYAMIPMLEREIVDRHGWATSEELMERFVRGDSSRSTEGNGLGLAIAKSLMELMKGRLLLSIDGDLFKVILEFPR